MQLIDTLVLEAALKRAAHPNTPQGELLALPLRHIAVWSAVAGRRRVPSAVRTALFDVATEGGLRWEGQGPGEDYSAFYARFSCTIVAARWLTRRRLVLLTPRLARIAAQSTAEDAARLIVALAAHPNADMEVVGLTLDGFLGQRAGLVGSPWDASLDALGQLGHPWPMFADVCAQTAADVQRGSSSLRWRGKTLAGIDELSGRVLLGMLSTWRGDFASAVASARDVGGNPDPADLAIAFVEPLTADEWQLACRLASDPDTSIEQLMLLPVGHVVVWSKVAQRDDLTTDLRTQLVKVALTGPRMMGGRAAGQTPGEWATVWATHVLGAPWLTGHRLGKLGAVAARNSAHPEALVAALVKHPRVTGRAFGETFAHLHFGTRPDQSTPWSADVAIEALSASRHGGPWPALGPVMALMRVPVRDYPDWHLALGRWNVAGRHLDRLRLAPAHLERLLRLLPTWSGDLGTAVEETRAK